MALTLRAFIARLHGLKHPSRELGDGIRLPHDDVKLLCNIVNRLKHFIEVLESFEKPCRWCPWGPLFGNGLGAPEEANFTNWLCSNLRDKKKVEGVRESQYWATT